MLACFIVVANFAENFSIILFSFSNYFSAVLVKLVYQRLTIFVLNDSNIFDVRTFLKVVSLAWLQIFSARSHHCHIEQVACTVDSSVNLPKLRINLDVDSLADLELESVLKELAVVNNGVILVFCVYNLK